MKRIMFILLFGILLFSSCATTRRHIKDYGDKMLVLQENFPEIYDLFRSGDVSVDVLYKYTKNGVEKYHIEYHYIKDVKRAKIPWIFAL